MALATRLGRTFESAQRRSIHASAVAQAASTPGARLRPQTAPKLRSQTAPRLSPQLQAAQAPSPATPTTSPSAAPQTAPRLAPKGEKYARTPLTPEARAQQFAARLARVADHTGVRPTARDGVQVRDTAWNQLLDLAASRADVEKVVELMPRWLAMKRTFRPETVKWFMERTYQLGCPDLALRVFTEPQRFGIRVPSLTAGATLIAAAVRRAPADAPVLAQAAGLVGVMQMQGHPGFATALAPCAVLLRALVDPRWKNAASERVARSLLPQLRALVTARAPLAKEALAAAGPTRRWALTAGLLGVQRWMAGAGETDARWLWAFREQSGLLAPGETADPRMSKAPVRAPTPANMVELMRTAAEEKGLRVSV